MALYLFIKSQLLSHSWIYVTLQQNKHCYNKFHFWLANVKYEYNHILSLHRLKKHTKDYLIASFVYNQVQRLIPFDSQYYWLLHHESERWVFFLTCQPSLLFWSCDTNRPISIKKMFFWDYYCPARPIVVPAKTFFMDYCPASMV